MVRVKIQVFLRVPVACGFDVAASSVRVFARASNVLASLAQVIHLGKFLLGRGGERNFETLTAKLRKWFFFSNSWVVTFEKMFFLWVKKHQPTSFSPLSGTHCGHSSKRSLKFFPTA